ncbi:MAG: DegT/DnrJ/EryC1/StrS family aminotransferase [Caldilinea sp.]|nr:DegT/DnrJ/EryC1/StrS family aminotransferase [Caldilinea sp.]MDW8442753.1 DegT/DnrJ/EryC1/StrS family aminotransferase [Caldilineaceae bacterium]
MIPIAKPLIGEEEKAAVLDVLGSGQLAQGRCVREFEERFAAWVGARNAVAVSSGTTALHVALLAHGVGSGDEVITTPFSFIASANCILYVGATPRFADIESEYYTIDPTAVEAQITPRTRAILPVHLFGQPCDMEAIAAIAERHGLAIIEDACQAHGARLAGRPVGSWGTACYSFYPTKNMTTGEGGMITTDDSVLAERMRMIREHGMRQRYVHETLGYNFRMTDVQAAIGLVQLTRVDGWNEQRRRNAALLTAQLAGVSGVKTPEVRPGAVHVFHQYTVAVEQRERVIAALTAQAIGYGIYYPIPIHRQQVYRERGYSDVLPVAEAASARVLSLPVHPALTEDDMKTVADAVIAAVREPVLS